MISVYQLVAILLFVCVFFSSRRRHTRFDCDWSSDVCSSDLCSSKKDTARSSRHAIAIVDKSFDEGRAKRWLTFLHNHRSEERRVGKECRSRWSPDHEKKKHDEEGIDGL